MDSLSTIGDQFMALAIFCLFACLYVTYYITRVVKAPVISCGDKKLRTFIDKHCSIAQEKYWPTWWAFGARTQTVLRALIQRAPDVQYTEEIIKCPDGGLVRLDWFENDENSRHSTDSRPTILMFPGLTGNSSETYIRHMVKEATILGYRSVVLNNRGTCGTPLKTPRTYCAANTEDAAHVISHIKQKYPEAPVMGVGISLGGMILFNYMAHHGTSAGLVAAMCISVNWNVGEGIRSLEEPLNYHLFNRVLAKALCCLVDKHSDVLKQIKDLDIPHVMKSLTIRDFDERFTSKVFGYESVEHYYEAASLHTKVHALGKPVLCLSAGDDPFSPERSVPLADAAINDNIAIVMTARGGHIGFLEGSAPLHDNYMTRWFKQYVTGVFEHGFKDE